LSSERELGGNEPRILAERLLKLTSGDGRNEELALVLLRPASVKVLDHENVRGGVEGGNFRAVTDTRVSEGIRTKGLLQEVLNNSREAALVSHEVGSIVSIIAIIRIGNPEGRVHARGDVIGFTPFDGGEARVKRKLKASAGPISARSIAIANSHVGKLTREEKRVNYLLDAGVGSPKASELSGLHSIGERLPIGTKIGVVFPFSMATAKHR
jgi:hypothetical protein